MSLLNTTASVRGWALHNMRRGINTTRHMHSINKQFGLWYEGCKEEAKGHGYIVISCYLSDLYLIFRDSVMCLNFGTPKNNEFSIWDKWKN